MLKQEYTQEEKEKIAKAAAEKTAAYEAEKAAAKAHSEAIREEKRNLTPDSKDLYKYSVDKRSAAIRGLESDIESWNKVYDEYKYLRGHTKRTDAQQIRYQQLQDEYDKNIKTYEMQKEALEKLKEGEEFEDLDDLKYLAEAAAILQAKRDYEQAARDAEKVNVDRVDLLLSRAQDRSVNQGTTESAETMAQDNVNLGGDSHIIGPNGIITSDKSYYEGWEKLIGGFKAKPLDKGVFDPGKLIEYGNNYFTLFTYYNGLEPDTQLVADGVMTELPPISMSTEWDNSPAASIGEVLDKALNNEFLEFMSMRTTQANSPIMRRKDQLTARCYKDTGDIGFEIKFRVYPGQTVGSQRFTTAKEWLLLLSMTTPINAACTFSIDNTLGEITNAADGVVVAFQALKDYLNSGNKKDANNLAGQKSTDLSQPFTTIEGAMTRGNPLTSFGDDDARISNPNVFGACLFGLRIYPWIFRKPITIYIDNWSVTPSKEWNEDQHINDHYYYDFTLSCKMDQKPSAATWVDSLLV